MDGKISHEMLENKSHFEDRVGLGLKMDRSLARDEAKDEIDKVLDSWK